MENETLIQSIKNQANNEIRKQKEQFLNKMRKSNNIKAHNKTILSPLGGIGRKPTINANSLQISQGFSDRYKSLDIKFWNTLGEV